MISAEDSVLLAFPRKFDRLDRVNGTFKGFGSSDNIYKLARTADKNDGIFVDIGLQPTY